MKRRSLMACAIVITAVATHFLGHHPRIFSQSKAGHGTLADRSWLERTSISDEEPDDTPKDVPWKLLSFRAGHAQEDVTSVILAIPDESVEKVRRLFGLRVQIDATEIVLTDGRMLRLFESCFDYSQCLARVIPKGVHGGWGLNDAIGTFTIRTTSGEFVVGITMSGFALGSDNADMNNVFYSPLGTELLSMIYYDRHRKVFPIEISQVLSGAHFINHERHLFGMYYSHSDR